MRQLVQNLSQVCTSSPHFTRRLCIGWGTASWASLGSSERSATPGSLVAATKRNAKLKMAYTNVINACVRSTSENAITRVTGVITHNAVATGL